MAKEESASLAQAMQLMLNAGDAKKAAKEAIAVARDGKFTEAEQKLATAQEKLNTAHNLQTKMLTAEAQGQQVKLSLLTVHAQDHLMTAITYIDLAEEIIRLYKRLGE
ncbi:PTS lactose/cellobiose transporter subunit IIA [Limosilactobacillus sp.]|uniref:PTS lactose/cellobiose transporter subunit IIA n=1 Tax=Limosilactobacillus sp. TaxID=2773925 RepID=UPI003F0EDDA2